VVQAATHQPLSGHLGLLVSLAELARMQSHRAVVAVPVRNSRGKMAGVAVGLVAQVQRLVVDMPQWVLMVVSALRTPLAVVAVVVLSVLLLVLTAVRGVQDSAIHSKLTRPKRMLAAVVVALQILAVLARAVQVAVARALSATRQHQVVRPILVVVAVVVVTPAAMVVLAATAAQAL
jgi:hypothetical protein